MTDPTPPADTAAAPVLSRDGASSNHADPTPETLTSADPLSSADWAPAAATSQIEPWLRDILRCPQCRSRLVDGVGPRGPELHCTNTECQLAYRVDDGIPVLLVDESRSLAG